ncbi:MAG TPA: DUF5919 domain-containing protein [Mycobacteriales bacterium]|nr:DUF5919 domain-containing protein [Mycobacteriales bacterium]
MARLLGVDARSLWATAGERGNAADEIVAAYAHRADVPPALWQSQVETATRHVDLLGYAMQFLFESHPSLVDLLRRKGQDGCQVRIAIVDPTSPEAANRDREEQLDDGLLARIRTAIKYMSPLVDAPGVAIRQHRTPMYNSIFRYDEDLLVTPHLYAAPGFMSPLLHLRRSAPDCLFETFLTHFERVWDSAERLEGV